mgnify:CR=1 FL=1
MEFSFSAHQIFEDSLRAMFKRSYEGADKIFSRIREYGGIEKDIATMIFTKKLDPNLASVLRLILDTLRSILEYSRNIAEVTLNRTIEEIISPVS